MEVVTLQLHAGVIQEGARLLLSPFPSAGR